MQSIYGSYHFYTDKNFFFCINCQHIQDTDKLYYKRVLWSSNILYHLMYVLYSTCMIYIANIWLNHPKLSSSNIISQKNQVGDLLMYFRNLSRWLMSFMFNLFLFFLFQPFNFFFFSFKRNWNATVIRWVVGKKKSSNKMLGFKWEETHFWPKSYCYPGWSWFLSMLLYLKWVQNCDAIYHVYD